MLASATALLTEAGLTALGSTRDDEAQAWLQARSISELLVGGGVPTPDFERLRQAGQAAGIKVTRVQGMPGMAAWLAQRQA
jgi:hypothetical protein